MQGMVDDGSVGWVFNIQRYSVHDGPGIRTTVFLKGCPLRCLWCSNPESQRPEPQIVFWPDRCIGCDACRAACPRSTIAIDEAGYRRVLAERCDGCGQCVETCYAEAVEQVGRSMTVEEVLAAVEADHPFYDQSGGGMTLSGGEPLAQPEFSLRLLRGAQQRGIHTVLETCGHAPWDVWQSLLPHVDLILYDVKDIDPDRHRHNTGVSNELILDNLERLSSAGVSLIVRRPVIPGYNDDVESIHALARFAGGLGTVHEIDLLPYHRFGRDKYKRLGRNYAMGDATSLQEEDVIGLRDILASYGFRVKIGG